MRAEQGPKRAPDPQVAFCVNWLVRREYHQKSFGQRAERPTGEARSWNIAFSLISQFFIEMAKPNRFIGEAKSPKWRSP